MTIALEIDDDLVRWLEREADRRGVTVSVIVSEAVTRYLQRQTGQPTRPPGTTTTPSE